MEKIAEDNEKMFGSGEVLERREANH